MSRQAVSRDLYSLMPGWTTALPAELVDLTTSLLAQSRSKAGSLKKDEEIARGYVCAHIACERLKRSLDLPDITPRPPLHQRTYKKVYQYLSSALIVAPKQQPAVNAPATPSKSRKETSATPRTGKASRPAATTPARTALPHRSPGKKFAQTPTRKTGRDGSAHLQTTFITSSTPDAEYPSWISQSVRAICTAWSCPAATPHVFAGVASVVRRLTSQPGSNKSAARPQKVSRMKQNDGNFLLQLMPPLVFTIAIYTDTQFGSAPEAEGEYEDKRAQVYAIFKQHIPLASSSRAEQTSQADEIDELAHSNDETEPVNPHAEVRDAAKHGLLLPQRVYEDLCEEYNEQADADWLDMEWYTNVCRAAAAYKEDRAQADSDAMDLDLDLDHSSAASGAETAQPTTTPRKRRRDTLDAGASDDDDEQRSGAATQQHARHGGEMMLVRTGFPDADAQRAYDRWAARMRRRIADGRARLAAHG